MTTESAPQRSRRAIIAAAIGAAAASVASAVGRPGAAKAADGATVTVGGEFSAAVTRTGISSNTIGLGDSVFYAQAGGQSDALRGSATSGDGVVGVATTGSGVYGYSSGTSAAVYGTNSTYYAVEGYSQNWGGLRGSSTNGVGLSATGGTYGVLALTVAGSAGIRAEAEGQSKIGAMGVASGPVGDGLGVLGVGQGDAGAGVAGRSDAGRTGVLGFSAPDEVTALPAAPAQTGVYGRATMSASSRGVHGYSTSGRGVYGQATSGTGGHFQTSDPSTGTALRAVGRVRFDHASGVATLGTTASSIIVTPGTDLTSTSAVTATLLSDAGSVMVRRVAVNTAADTFTIVLTGSAPAGTRIAWHVFG